MSARRPSDNLARRGDNGGGKRRQMATMTASARTPAPRNRGRLTSKPTVEGQPFGGDYRERRQRDPRPDLELASVRGLDGDRPRWWQRQPVGRLELRDRVGEQIHAEPRALHLARDHLLRATCTSCRSTFASNGSPASTARTRPMPTADPPASAEPAGGSTIRNGPSGKRGGANRSNTVIA